MHYGTANSAYSFANEYYNDKNCMLIVIPPHLTKQHKPSLKSSYIH